MPCADRATCGCGHLLSGLQVALTLHSQAILFMRLGQNDAPVQGEKHEQVLSAVAGS